jgi:hypothetical protein
MLHLPIKPIHTYTHTHILISTPTPTHSHTGERDSALSDLKESRHEVGELHGALMSTFCPLLTFTVTLSVTYRYFVRYILFVRYLPLLCPLHTFFPLLTVTLSVTYRYLPLQVGELHGAQHDLEAAATVSFNHILLLYYCLLMPFFYSTTVIRWENCTGRCTIPRLLLQC